MQQELTDEQKLQVLITTNNSLATRHRVLQDLVAETTDQMNANTRRLVLLQNKLGLLDENGNVRPQESRSNDSQPTGDRPDADS